jgi:hypothetical protein
MWTTGEHLCSRSSASIITRGVIHVRHSNGPMPFLVSALMLVTIMQAVISASFSVAKLRSGSQSDADGKKRRDQPRELRQPAPPQSLAPWHTLPYMGREVRGCNNPVHGVYSFRFWTSLTECISICAGTLPGWRAKAQGQQQSCACTAEVWLGCIAASICCRTCHLTTAPATYDTNDKQASQRCCCLQLAGAPAGGQGKAVAAEAGWAPAPAAAMAPAAA